MYRILNRPEPQQDGSSILRFDGVARWVAEEYWFPSSQDVVVFRNAADYAIEVTVSGLMTLVPKGSVKTFFNITTITVKATVHRANEFFTLDCWTSTPTGGNGSGSNLGTVNVKSGPFNAKGDGVTDDTAAINAAIKSLPATGGAIFIPEGTYMINAGNPYNPLNDGLCIQLKSNVTISMTENTILKVIPNNFNNYAIFLLRGISNVTIEGGVLIGERYDHTFVDPDAQGGMGVWLHAAKNVTIRNMTCKEFMGDGVYTRFHDTLGNTIDVSVENCSFIENRRQGISICANEDFRVSNCYFYGTFGEGGHDPGAGIDIEPELGGTVKNVTITGNVFVANKVGIQGLGQSGAIISGNIFDGNTMWGIYLADTADCSVTGNKIFGSGDHGIYCNFASNNTITGNVVYSNGNYGIYLLNDCNKNVLTGNRVYSNAQYGIGLFNADDCIVKGNNVSQNGSVGIDLSNSFGAVVSGNRIYNNVRSGINLWKVKDSLVEGNHVNNNLQHGIILKGDEAGDSFDVTFNGNHCSGNGQEAPNFYNNMCLQSGVVNGIARASLAGNTCRAGSATNKPQYGLFITAGTLDTYLGDNDFRGGGQSADMFDSGTGTVTPFDSFVIPDTSIVYSQPSGLPFKWTVTDAGVGTLAFDGQAYALFDGPDSTTTLGNLNQGGTWAYAQGTWGISSNKAYAVTDVDGDCALTPALPSADMAVKCTVSGEMGSFSTYRLPQVVAKWVDANNYIRAYIMGNWITLEMKFGGEKIDMGPTGGIPNTTVNGQDYTIEVVVVGTNVKMYLDGVLKADYTMTAGQAAVLAASKIAGIRIGKGGAPTLPARFNNFIVQ